MTIAGEQAIQVLGCFEALGLCSQDVCARVGLAPSSLAAPGTRISRVLFESLFLAAAELRGDALVGLRAGMAKAPADLLLQATDEIARQVQSLRGLAAKRVISMRMWSG